MPDRIVRAGILSSEPVNSLSWAAEVLYRRLLSVVDDYGRYDGRSTMLRAHLYPLKIDRVSDADVGKWLTECVTAGLVSVYQVSGQRYLEVAKFGQRVRADKSKWPDPPTSAVICQQPHASAPVFVFGDGGVSEGEGSGTAQSAAPPPPPAFDGKNAEALNGKAVVPLSAKFELPEQWGLDAEALGFKRDEVLREAEKLRQWATEGKGKGTRRSVKGWRQTWSNWLGKAAENKR